MIKDKKTDKSRIMLLLLVFAATSAKLMIYVFRSGSFNLLMTVLSFLASVLFVVFFFLKFPFEFKELFNGKSFVTVIAALLTVIVAFSEDYISADFLITVTAMFSMMIFSSDLRLLPLNVVLSIASTVTLSNTGVAAIPAAMCVIIVTAAPLLKKAELWKKLVFSASTVLMAVDLVYVFYIRRFMVQLNAFIAHPVLSVAALAIAVLFVLFLVLTLKENKSSVLQSVGYLIPAASLSICAFMDRSYTICNIIAALMAIILICRTETQAKLVTDKVAGAIGKAFTKLLPEKDAE